MSIWTPIAVVGGVLAGVVSGIWLREHEVLTMTDVKKSGAVLAEKARLQCARLKAKPVKPEFSAEPAVN